MSTVFSAITEDFYRDLEAIRFVVQTFDTPSASNPRARVSAANSATLLLTATFEEFVREMARAYARSVVSGTPSYDRIPPRMPTTVWKRTMTSLSRMRFDPHEMGKSTPNAISRARARFDAAYNFCNGDLSQDIYEDLIVNEGHMRTPQINSLFKVSNLKNLCSKISDKQSLLDYFNETDINQVTKSLDDRLNDFFERRNRIAHSLNATHSSAPTQISKDIDFFCAVAHSVCDTLEEKTTR